MAPLKASILCGTTSDCDPAGKAVTGLKHRSGTTTKSSFMPMDLVQLAIRLAGVPLKKFFALSSSIRNNVIGDVQAFKVFGGHAELCA